MNELSKLNNWTDFNKNCFILVLMSSRFIHQSSFYSSIIILQCSNLRGFCIVFKRLIRSIQLFSLLNSFIIHHSLFINNLTHQLINFNRNGLTPNGQLI